MISRFLAAIVETERRCFTKVILKSKVVQNTSRQSDSFRTAPAWVNGSERSRYVLGLGTLIVIVLIAFKSHNAQVTPTLMKSRFRNFETIASHQGMAKQKPKWSDLHNRIAPKFTGGTSVNVKNIESVIPDKTSTSLN